MGALHQGHMSLLERSQRDCDRTVVSIFVNPTQFDRAEDLASYPSDPSVDLEKLQAAACDAAFLGSPDALYGPGYVTWVSCEGPLTEGLCGRARPGHFRGVTTIVAKLFNIVQPTRAYFGRKDLQQLSIIRRMAQDLDMPTEVIGCPTVREPDGLALSSRNALLSPEGRERALAISGSLSEAGRRYRAGDRRSAGLLTMIRAALTQAGARVDYIAAVDGPSLEPRDVLDDDAHIALAAFVDGVRLIDNHRVSEGPLRP
jgi:pantoate--beta-alanine ligase